MHRLLVPTLAAIFVSTSVSMGGVLRRGVDMETRCVTENDSVEFTWWCDVLKTSRNSQVVENLKRKTWREGDQVFRYMDAILGNSMINIPSPVVGLKSSSDYCGEISLPAPPETNYTTRLQNISDRLWEMGHLITLYHMTVRKLELQQTIFQGEEDVSKLEFLGITLDYYHSSAERYLQASGCSCEGFNCSLHSKQDLAHIEADFTKGRHPCCTTKLFLGKIIAEATKFSRKIHKYFRSPFIKSRFCSAVQTTPFC